MSSVYVSQPRVDLRDIADRLGKSVDAVRRAINRKQIEPGRPHGSLRADLVPKVFPSLSVE